MDDYQALFWVNLSGLWGWGERVIGLLVTFVFSTFQEYNERLMHYMDAGPYFDSLEHLIEHYARFKDGMKCQLVGSINNSELFNHLSSLQYVF